MSSQTRRGQVSNPWLRLSRAPWLCSGLSADRSHPWRPGDPETRRRRPVAFGPGWGWGVGGMLGGDSALLQSQTPKSHPHPHCVCFLLSISLWQKNSKEELSPMSLSPRPCPGGPGVCVGGRRRGCLLVSAEDPPLKWLFSHKALQSFLFLPIDKKMRQPFFPVRCHCARMRPLAELV